MKFYRVHHHTEGGISAGFSWFTSRRKAERAAAADAADKGSRDVMTGEPIEPDPVDEAEIEVFEIAPTKAGILVALARYASHADNG